MRETLLDQLIKTEYGQFDLLWGADYGFDGDFDRFFAGQSNGLVGAASGQGLYVHFARRCGGSPVRIVLLDSAPAPDPGQWEDIVEVSVTVPAGASPHWSTWAGEHGDTFDLAAGTYRVRASARGRDAGRAAEYADGAVDFYLLEIWLAPAQPDSIIRSTSADAAYWHREVGGRR